MTFTFGNCYILYVLGLLHSEMLTLCGATLKVPKREIFDHSDFPDFHTKKSLREGDFGVKI